jgi:hypothetical protein
LAGFTTGTSAAPPELCGRLDAILPCQHSEYSVDPEGGQALPDVNMRIAGDR